MKKRSVKIYWLGFLSLFLFVALYQNCAPIQLSNDDVLISPKVQNGGPYGGMFKIYRHYSAIQPCSVKDLKGKALANTEIIFKPDQQGENAPFLARESCTDLQNPVMIAPGELQIVDSGLQTIRYKNLDFTSQNSPGDFDLVAAKCPAGLTEMPGALRTNLFVHSLDWTVLRASGTPGWYSYSGIGATLFSTIQSLPAYKIYRNDPASLDLYRRQSQAVQLKSNTDYAFSFVAQAGSVRGADVHLYRGMNSTPGPDDESVLATFDLQTGTTNIQYSVNVSGVSATMTPFGSGYLCTLYFRSSGTADQFETDIGVTPTTAGNNFGQLNDSILATAAQLVEVPNFCR